jgi:hypothetical protein
VATYIASQNVSLHNAHVADSMILAVLPDIIICMIRLNIFYSYHTSSMGCDKNIFIVGTCNMRRSDTCGQ